MKAVLVPIDFSNEALNALSFATELCKRAAASLLVVYVSQDKELEAEARKKIKIVESRVNKAAEGSIKTEFLFVQGKLVMSLNKILEDRLPDLIVMGSKGASGLKRILIGSNTVNVIAKTKVPVLVIPEKARFSAFLRRKKSRIVVATDLEAIDNEQALDLLKEIALLIIEPKIRVLSVRKKNTGLNFNKVMEREALLSVFKSEVETDRVTVFSRDVLSGLNFYLKKHDDTGLVAMIARNSGSAIRRHYTREMASRTQLPLLVLRDTES